jgi:hypothetical protein
VTAAHAFEYELPDDDARLTEIVDNAAGGEVVYLSRRGRHLAAVVQPGEIGVRGAIRRDRLLTDTQKAILLSMVDELERIGRASDQEWYWKPDWQAGEREADVDIAAGRGRIFGSDEAFLDALEAGVDDPSALS